MNEATTVQALVKQIDVLTRALRNAVQETEDSYESFIEVAEWELEEEEAEGKP